MRHGDCGSTHLALFTAHPRRLDTANRSPRIGVLSICAAFVQLTGYGCGFFKAWWRRCVCGKDEFQAYEKTFYK